MKCQVSVGYQKGAVQGSPQASIHIQSWKKCPRAQPLLPILSNGVLKTSLEKRRNLILYTSLNKEWSFRLSSHAAFWLVQASLTLTLYHLT